MKIKQNIYSKAIWKNKKKLEIHNKEEVDEILKNIDNGKYIVTEVKKGERKKAPAPPFTTSTMPTRSFKKIRFYIKENNVCSTGVI